MATNVAEKGGLLRAQQRESVWHGNQEETQWKFDWEFWNLKGERTLSSIRRDGVMLDLAHILGSISRLPDRILKLSKINGPPHDCRMLRKISSPIASWLSFHIG